MKKLKGWLVNAVASWLGIKTLWEKASGYRTKAAATAMILAGVSMLLGDVSALKDVASALELAKTIMEHAGTLRILEGLAGLGLRAAVKK